MKTLSATGGLFTGCPLGILQRDFNHHFFCKYLPRLYILNSLLEWPEDHIHFPLPFPLSSQTPHSVHIQEILIRTYAKRLGSEQCLAQENTNERQSLLLRFMEPTVGDRQAVTIQGDKCDRLGMTHFGVRSDTSSSLKTEVKSGQISQIIDF